MGTVVTLTATVSAGTTSVTPGIVNFCDATAISCTDIHLRGTAQLTSFGTATIKFVPSLGKHSYKAMFLGTNGFSMSVSTPSELLVTGTPLAAGADMTYLTAAPEMFPFSSRYTLTATVVAAGGPSSPSPTGQVSFLDTTEAAQEIGKGDLIGGGPGVNFLSPEQPPPGAIPNSAVVADFNGDGYADLAQTSNDTNTVSVLLGHGDGTFTLLGTPSTTGNDPVALVAADFNSDGKLDLAFANLQDGTVSVLLGGGDGTFSLVATLLTGNYPYSVLAGDFNHDGILDLALAVSASESVPPAGGSGAVVLFSGHGDGTFAASGTPVPITPANFSPLVTGDFNGDGLPDLAVSSNPGSSLTLLLANGDGTFHLVSPSIGYVAAWITAADFNNDGKADLAALNDASVAVLLGNGDGTFQTPVYYPSTDAGGASIMLAGDFNSDGMTDLAFPYPSSSDFQGVTVFNQVRVLAGKGDGTLAPYTSPQIAPFGLPPSFIAGGDFNGDGATDIILGAQNYSAGLRSLLSQATQTSTATLDKITVGGTGPHQVIASYPGDSTYGASASTPTTLTGVPATALAIVAYPPGGSDSGQAVTLVADLTPKGSQSAPPNGELIDFYEGDLELGIGTIVNGSATFVSSALSPGTNSIYAAYSGDGMLAASKSNVLSYVVSKAAFITIVIPDHTYGDAPFSITATSNSNGPFTYSVLSGPAIVSGATVKLTGAGSVVVQASQAATGSYPAMGTQQASFTVGPAPLAAVVSNAARTFGAANPPFTAVLTGVINNDLLTTSFTTTAGPGSLVGGYPITVSVAGANSTSYNITETPGTLTITQAGTVTSLSLSNQNLTLTAQVQSLTSGTPTGNVDFYEGQTLVGTGVLVNGSASYTQTSVPAGDVPVSAQYSGDANFTQSASPPIPVISLVPTSSAVTVGQAASVTDTVNLNPAPGFTGAIQLSCTNLPQFSTCSFQPSSVDFTGSSSHVKVTVTIQTGVSNQAGLGGPAIRDSGEFAEGLAAVFWLPGIFSLVSGRRRLSPLSKLLLLFCCIGAGVTGCGGGSSHSTPSQAKTPAGSFVVHLVASGAGGVSQIADLNLTVQ